MNGRYSILPLTIAVVLAATCGPELRAQTNAQNARIDFGGDDLEIRVGKSTSAFDDALSTGSILGFYRSSLEGKYDDVIRSLRNYRSSHQPDDWLYYQLIRRTVEYISPKKDNYNRYTLYKWYFLSRTGFDAILTLSKDKILFYVQCDENIYNIPNRIKNGKQYVCLNYHDYGGDIDFEREHFTDAGLPSATVEKTFSYKVTRLPDFSATEYLEKDLHFSYYKNDYTFRLKLTPQVEKLFSNYPVVDYDAYLNIPMSRETYNSLIPQLRRNLKGMKVKSGVDYLMRFTRYAFLFESDTEHFGGEKRLSPEQTLLYDQSDCEDRVALFFYLVREIYDLPMIVLAYPNHVTVAVQFDKPAGASVNHEGRAYTICEPTPQKLDLQIGQTLPELDKQPYEVAYVYHPKKR